MIRHQMKASRVLVAIIVCTIAMLCAYGQHADPALMRDFQRLFGTDDAHARLIAFGRLESRVPQPGRADVLRELWDSVQGRADANAVHASVLAYLIAVPKERLPWNPALQQRISAVRRDREPGIRRLVLNTFLKLGPSIARDDALAFLDDPSDQIREAAVEGISRWPERLDLLKRYVRNNEKSPEHADSVRRARSLLQKLQGGGP